MKVMAESFSDMGVPVFMADVKGDVSGLAEPGENNEGMQKRIRRFGLESIFRYTSYPVAFGTSTVKKGSRCGSLFPIWGLCFWVDFWI